jgi:hypothetical protein
MTTSFLWNRWNGVSKNPSFYTDLKNVHLTFIKNAHKKGCPKNHIGRKKAFISQKGQGKGQKFKKLPKYFEKRFFYKQILDFHGPLKILCETSKNDEICQKSLLPNEH